jgi:hypothetical protein
MDEKYLEECKENAIRKKKLELEILHTKSLTVPIESSIFENYTYFNSSPGTLESYELVMEWIRDVRLGANHRNMLFHQISSHEGFVGLYALNSLRRNKNPNYLYFHGIVEIKGKETTEYPMSPKNKASPVASPKIDYDDIVRNNSTFYTLSEDLFSDEAMFEYSFKDICVKDNWIMIMSYFLSLVLSLYNANKDISYTNYDLNIENIMMKNMSVSMFDVEYNFEDENLWVTNYGYIPTITRFSKSYTKILFENVPKSFGYNNLSQIPFEEKGIYCDRGFIITDVYSLLMGILEATYLHNKDAYNHLKVLLNFFTKEEPVKLFAKRYFIPYCNLTENLRIEDFVKYIFKVYPEFKCYRPKNDVIRCIGTKLEIKSKSIEYYTIKNTIQLYDLIKYYSSFTNEDNSDSVVSIINKSIQYYVKFFEKENLIRDVERLKNILNILSNKSIIFEVPDSPDIFRNKNYSNIFKEYLNHSILYFNTWERLNISIKIMNYIFKSSEIFKEIYENYQKIHSDNKEYYEYMYQNLISFRAFFRRNLNFFRLYKKQVLFLESLE